MQKLETSAAWVNGQPPAFALRIWLGLALVGGFELGRVVLTIALAMAKS
jgi:phycobilisome rod-core linker protein